MFSSSSVLPLRKVGRCREVCGLPEQDGKPSGRVSLVVGRWPFMPSAYCMTIRWSREQSACPGFMVQFSRGGPAGRPVGSLCTLRCHQGRRYERASTRPRWARGARACSSCDEGFSRRCVFEQGSVPTATLCSLARSLPQSCACHHCTPI